MDVPEKDCKAYTTEMVSNYNIEEPLRQMFEELWPNESEETGLRSNDSLTIDWMGESMFMVFDRKNDDVFAMMTKHLSPLSKAEDTPIYYRRGGMIAIKQGLLLSGLVYASSLSHANGFTDAIKDLASVISRGQIREIGKRATDAFNNFVTEVKEN